MVMRYDTRGLRDWIVQRVTSVIIGAYALFLISYLFSVATVDYQVMQHLFANLWMRLATMVAMLSIIWHAWIGLWTVLTDYVKCKYIRFVLEVAIMVLLVGYLVTLADIFWG